MFSYLRSFFIDSKTEFQALKDIGVLLFLYQTIIRIILFIIFGVFYSFFIQWIVRDPGSDFLFVTGMDTFKYLYLDRVIIVVVFLGFLFLMSLFIETLGVYSIARQYYLGHKITLRRTFFETIRYFKINLKVQTLKYLYIFSNIFFTVFFLYVIFLFFPNTLGLILSIFLIVQNIIIIIHKSIEYKDVGQKVFENKKNIFDIYGYKMTSKRKHNILKFYIFKIVLIVFLTIVVPTSFLLVTQWICFANLGNQFFSAFLLALNFSGFVGVITVLSYLYISFFSLRSTRKYLEAHDQKAKKFLPYTNKKSYIIFGLLAIFSLVFVIFQTKFFSDVYEHKVLHEKEITIFAHRASGMTPSNNSIEALQYSIDHQVEFVEIDVQLSKEGIPVVFHDYTYFDGKQKKYIQNTPLEELKKYDLRTKKNSNNENRETIPTLEEFLKVAKGKIQVNIEIKTTENFEMELAEKVAEIVKKTQMNREVMITSFEYKILKKIKQLLPNIETGLIITAYIGELEEIDEMDIDWLMVNNVYFSLNQSTFENFGDKKIALWSFNKNFDGSDAIYENIQGVIVDNPDKTEKKIQDFNALPLGERYYKQIENIFLLSL